MLNVSYSLKLSKKQRRLTGQIAHELVFQDNSNLSDYQAQRKAVAWILHRAYVDGSNSVGAQSPSLDYSWANVCLGSSRQERGLSHGNHWNNHNMHAKQLLYACHKLGSPSKQFD